MPTETKEERDKAKAASKAIDKGIKEDKKQSQKLRKVLLLGTGEAGKSTFIKQLKIIKSTEFTAEEKQQYKEDIASNILVSILTLADNVKSSISSEFQNDYIVLTGLSERTYDRPKPEEVFAVKNHIERLWNFPNIQEAYKQRATFQLPDSAKHFLDQVEEVMSPDHEITSEDILNAR